MGKLPYALAFQGKILGGDQPGRGDILRFCLNRQDFGGEFVPTMG